MQYLGCDVNQQNAKGYTPLHRAASKGNLTIISCLLHNGQYQHSIKKHGNLINLGRQVIFFFSFLSIVIIVINSFPTKEDLEIYQNRMFIFLSVHLSMASDFWYSSIFIRLNIRCSYLTQRLQKCH